MQGGKMIDYNADYETTYEADQGICLHEGCGKIFELNVGGADDRCMEHGGAARSQTEAPRRAA
jgi:hypothetical protein